MRAHLGKKLVFLTNTHWFYAYFSIVFSRIVMVILSQVGDLRNKVVCLPLAYISSLKSSSLPSTVRFRHQLPAVLLSTVGLHNPNKPNQVSI